MDQIEHVLRHVEQVLTLIEECKIDRSPEGRTFQQHYAKVIDRLLSEFYPDLDTGSQKRVLDAIYRAYRRGLELSPADAQALLDQRFPPQPKEST